MKHPAQASKPAPPMSGALWSGPAGWHRDGPRLFDLAMAIALDQIQRMDERRRRKFDERLQAWASSCPPPAGAKVATVHSRAGDRFVGLLTSVARRSVRKYAADRDDEQSLFCEGVHKGLERLVKYWGPGRRHRRRCPVRYSVHAVKSACWNAVRRKRNEAAQGRARTREARPSAVSAQRHPEGAPLDLRVCRPYGSPLR